MRRSADVNVSRTAVIRPSLRGAEFFAVFATDQSGGAGVPLNPANVRIFLRFTDTGGTVRSNGDTWLESGDATLAMHLRAANDNTPGHFTGFAGKGALAGVFEPQRAITLVDEQASGTRLDIWGVHDVRAVPTER